MQCLKEFIKFKNPDTKDKKEMEQNENYHVVVAIGKYLLMQNIRLLDYFFKGCKTLKRSRPAK